MANKKIGILTSGGTAVIGDIPTGGRTVLTLNLTTGDDIEAIGDALEAFLEGANSGADLEVSQESNATITVAGIVPGSVVNDADAGTSGFSISETDGSGQAALSLSKRVSVLSTTAFAASDTQLYNAGGAGNLALFTLEDGAYTGQEKVIIRDGSDTLAGDMKVEIDNAHKLSLIHI